MGKPCRLTNSFFVVFLLLVATTQLAGEEDKPSINFEIWDRFAGSHATFSPQGNFLAYISAANQLMIDRQTSEAEVDPQRLRLLFQDLDSNSFQTRDNAYKKLLQMGNRIADNISAQLPKTDSLEAKERLRSIQASLKSSNRKLNARRIRQVLFSPNEQSLAITGDDRVVWLWRTASKARERLIGEFDSAVHSAAFSSDGRLLAMGTGNGKILVVDLEHANHAVELAGHTSAVHCLEFSPKSQQLISAGGFDRRIGIWDLSDINQLRGRSLNPEWLSEHRDSVLVVAISPDGERLVSSGYERDLFVWDLRKRRLLTTLGGHEKAVRCLEFNTKGSRMVSAGDDEQIRLWNMKSLTKIDTFDVKISKINKISCSSSSHQMAVSGKGNQVTVLKCVSFF